MFAGSIYIWQYMVYITSLWGTINMGEFARERLPVKRRNKDFLRAKHKVFNDLNRKRNFTIQEWRDIFQPVFDHVVDHLWKNLPMPTKDIKDVEQHVEEEFVRRYNWFIEGRNDFLFPPSVGSFMYPSNCWYKLMGLFFLTVVSKKIQVYSEPHDSVMRFKDSELYCFYEEREKRIEVHKDMKLYERLTALTGNTLDSEDGLLWGLWWNQCYSYKEIMAIYKILGIKQYSFSGVQRRMKLIFDDLEKELGVCVEDWRRLRIQKRKDFMKREK